MGYVELRYVMMFASDIFKKLNILIAILQKERFHMKC